MNWLQDIGKNLWDFIIDILFGTPQQPPMNTTPPPVPQPKPQPTISPLQHFAQCIQLYEGYAPGSRSYRNKNPGNMRCGFIMNHLAIGKDTDGFCIFPDYDTGLKALMRMIENACTGKSGVYKPTDTIIDFFGKYAPSGDNNNPQRYALFVASHMGLPPETPISTLVS